MKVKCPNCEDVEMRYVIDTLYAMDGQSDDDTNMYEWWQCPECHYYTGYVKGEG